MKTKINYGEAILAGFEYVLNNYPETFVIGQGLWSPWYVGNSMTDLDKKFGQERIIDTPVSEAACTGVAVGASLAGMRPIAVHPRMDFMLYCMDPIVNQAAKWSLMTGGQANTPLTVRAIVNRGGEQGAQHSQSLHSWFAHIPGLRVVMPATVKDARDLFIASVLCDDPTIFIDDRWLYDLEDELDEVQLTDLAIEGPNCVKSGTDITLVGSSYATRICLDAAKALDELEISAEVIDLRVLNPFNPEKIISSTKKTRRLIVVDGSWATCGIASEVLASVVEKITPDLLLSAPRRITLPFVSAPTPEKCEQDYYPNSVKIVEEVKRLFL